MEENCSVPSPINLNCWKHHAGFIKKQITHVQSAKDIEKIRSDLLKIGESQMDLYFGNNSPIEISRQIIIRLQIKEVFLCDQFKIWISEKGNGFRNIELDDKSIWTLRVGEGKQRYAHIHPGRYSPHTIRTKANTLKTAILVLCFQRIGELDITDTVSVNQIRKKHLNDPPIKSLAKSLSLRRTLNLLS